ncbi:MAG: hypothetical protein ABIH34_04825 [Nanoarchaeota archaeon]
METDEPMENEDIAGMADDKVDALIHLLIKKNLITEDEMDAAIDDLYEEAEEKPEE